MTELEPVENSPVDESLKINEAILIQLCRLYDIQLGILRELEKTAGRKNADKLFELHSTGGLLLSQVYLNPENVVS